MKVLSTLLLCLALSSAGAALADDKPSPASTNTQAGAAPAPAKAEPKKCCKVCDKGQACGDSCISRKYTCTKPPGCACQK